MCIVSARKLCEEMRKGSQLEEARQWVAIVSRTSLDL